jgi:tetratricopeptide (TPR) repeat protein
MRLIFYPVLFVLLIHPVLLFAQVSLPDSLSHFNTLPRDSAYVIQLNKLANDYLKLNTYAARRIAQHASDVAQQIKFRRGFARSLVVIGNSYWYEGLYDYAQNYYLLAAREYGAIKDSIGLGQVYNNLGEVYKRSGEYEKALKFLQQAVELKHGDIATLPITLYNIGELYNLSGKYVEARKYFEQSLSLAVKQEDQRVIGYNYWGFALSALKENKIHEALHYLEKAEQVFRSIHEIRLLMQLYLDFAGVFIHTGDFQKAEQYIHMAIDLTRHLPVPDLKLKGYYMLFRLDSARGNMKEAIHNLYRYSQYKDSVFNQVKTEQMARLQLAYETENRERENAELRANNFLNRARIEQQKIIIMAISLCLALVTALGWMLYRQRKGLIRINQLLKEKNREIELQKEELMTQSRKMQSLNEELISLNKTLEERIEQRTRQLALQNQQLMQYAHFIAHRLRAPVASILGLINLLDHNPDNDRDIILSHLKKCGQELDAITRQIGRDLDSGVIE